MAKLTLSVPVVGEKRSIAEPKVDTALKEVETWANGNIGSNNIEAKGVTEAMLSTAVQTLLNEKTAGGVMKKKVIATEQTRTSETFGVLATADEVELEMVENGLIAVAYQATWKESTKNTAKAAIFIDAVELKSAEAKEASAAATQTGIGGTEGKFAPLATSTNGL